MAVDYVDNPSVMLRRKSKKLFGEHFTTVESPVVVPIGHYLPHLLERLLLIVLACPGRRKLPKGCATQPCKLLTMEAGHIMRWSVAVRSVCSRTAMAFGHLRVAAT